MLDLIPYDVDPVLFGAIAIVIGLLGLARWHADPRLWSPRMNWFWNPIRRAAVPLLDAPLSKLPGAGAKTSVSEDEIVAKNLDITLEELRSDLAGASYVIRWLASVATFAPSGETERGSFARYHGPKPLGLEGLPDWLRRYQVHVRPFGPDGELTVTAHFEYNPWHPLYALPHLLGIGLDAERGVAMAAEDLDVEPAADS